MNKHNSLILRLGIWLLLLLMAQQVSMIRIYSSSKSNGRKSQEYDDLDHFDHHNRSHKYLDSEGEGLDNEINLHDDNEKLVTRRSYGKDREHSDYSVKGKHHNHLHKDKSDSNHFTRHRKSSKRNGRKKPDFHDEEYSDDKPHGYHHYSSYHKTTPVKIKGGKGWVSESRTHESVNQSKSSNRPGTISIGGFKTKPKFAETASIFKPHSFFSKPWGHDFGGINWNAPTLWNSRSSFGNKRQETQDSRRKKWQQNHSESDQEDEDRSSSSHFHQKESQSNEDSSRRHRSKNQKLNNKKGGFLIGSSKYD